MTDAEFEHLSAENERISFERWNKYCTIVDGRLVIDPAYLQSASCEVPVHTLFCKRHQEEKVWAGQKMPRKVCRSCQREHGARQRSKQQGRLDFGC